LIRQLKRAAIRDGDLDQEIANDWYGAVQEHRQELDRPGKPPRVRGTKEAKSTSLRSTRR